MCAYNSSLSFVQRVDSILADLTYNSTGIDKVEYKIIQDRIMLQYMNDEPIQIVLRYRGETMRIMLSNHEYSLGVIGTTSLTTTLKGYVSNIIERYYQNKRSFMVAIDPTENSNDYLLRTDTLYANPPTSGIRKNKKRKKRREKLLLIENGL